MDSDTAALVRADRVHRSVYTDPAIFALEQERLFARTWLYVGHESEIAAPGQYTLARLAGQPVILTRDKGGAIRLLFNRCAHRGAKVCLTPSGTVDRFVCPYHGWVFDLDGRLRGSPLRQTYAPGFDFSGPDTGLAPVARVASYRGFVFGSLAADGPSLTDFLGEAASAFDNMIERAPAGELRAIPGRHRHAYRGNWKMQIENLQDAAHPAFVHESSNLPPADAAAAAGDSVRGDSFMAANAIAAKAMDEGGIVAYPHGHSHIAALPVERRVPAAAHAEYRRRLAERLGETRADEVLAVNRHQNIIYPGLAVQAEFQTLKIITPVAVDRTEIEAQAFELVGAPREYHQMAIEFFNVTNSGASPILADDIVVYESAQEALAAPGHEWVLLAAGLGADTVRAGLRHGRGLSELAIRNQFRAWLDWMQPGRPRLAAAE